MSHEYTNAELRELPEFEEMVGMRPPDDFVSNGATFAPDVAFGKDLRCAAHWHDYAYSGVDCVLRTEWTRYAADRKFLLNLKTSGLCGVLGWVALIYYYRVRLWGTFCYSYSFPPHRGFTFWMSLLVGRYFWW